MPESFGFTKQQFQMKSKSVRGNWNLKTKKFGSISVIFLCIFFFLTGFFGSSLFSKPQDDWPRSGFLESTNQATRNSLLPAGESGDNSITSIPFQILSWKPRALYFPNFANSEQCERIIEMARRGLEPSVLALREGETEETTKGVRTSSGMFISVSEDKTGLLAVIEQKIARATMVPRVNGEAFNILRYKVGQKYLCHYDAFNPAEYGPQNSQRIASFLLYLSDVEEGGETMFPFENGLNMDGSYGYEDCVGLKVRPRQGDGLLFYSVLHNGTIDPTSLHGSCPVIKGEKWVATKWIRDQEHPNDY